MKIEEGNAALSPDRTEIERAIEQLYAAGLELQASADRTDISPCVTELVPSCVQRISDLMTDLRMAAGSRPGDTRS